MADYFVSPANGSDSTGDGSIGTPWASTQFALDNITQGASGDDIHIQEGAADVLTAQLSLSAYGTPTAAKLLTIRGYVSAARDGGRGEIDGDGSYSVYAANSNSNKSYINFIDMKLGNCGGNVVIRFREQSMLLRCEVWGSTQNTAVQFDHTMNRFIGCYFHDLSGTANIGGAGDKALFYGCTFVSGAGLYALQQGDNNPVFVRECVFVLNKPTGTLTAIQAKGGAIDGNTIVSLVANTGKGIDLVGGTLNYHVVSNNMIAGFSGAGGVGISLGASANSVIYGGNAFYNNATNLNDSSPSVYQIAPDIALAADPFVDAGNGDYRVKDASLAAGAAWPPAWPSLPLTTNARDIGAAQRAGAGIVRRVMRVIGG